MRKLTLAALALAVAGGVYLTGGTAQASNMGFKLEREFPPLPNYRNTYFVAFPLFNGLQDIADQAVSTPDDPCAPPDGDGDGIVNALDAICDLWTDRYTPGLVTPVFSFSKRDTSVTPCIYIAATLTFDPDFGGWAFASSFNSDLTTGVNREISFKVDVFSGVGSPATTNRAVIVGSHDPSHPGHRLTVTGGCLSDAINHSYHSMYTTANELLCGLEGFDWMDADSNGDPDTCGDASYAIYDNVSGAKTSVVTVLNDAGVPAPGIFQIRTASFDPDFGGLTFVGTNFPLIPGEGYRVDLSPGYNDKVFTNPHF